MIDMLKAIAEENRFRIIELLSEKSLCVCEIEAELKIPQNLVSHHLSVLKKTGLISDCRCGKNNYYTLNKQSLNKLTKTLTKLGDINENISTGIGMCNL
jgi:ArsR family transcriptional regulator